jgi:hypothetical protein
LPRPALACSCAGITPNAIEFEGTALDSPGFGTAGSRWRFRVASGRGVIAGDVVEVQLSVPVRSGDFMVSSSCDVGRAPIAGARYRVGAYASVVNGKRHYFAGGCGGYLQTARISHAPDKDASDSSLVAVLAIAAFAIATALLGRRARRT